MKLLILNLFIFVCLISVSKASDEVRNPHIFWAQDGMFDFCPRSEGFDYRNAYWLAAISYYTYWSPKYAEQIFMAPVGKQLQLKLQTNPERLSETTLVYGLGWNGKIDFFTSAQLLPESPKLYNQNHTSFFTAPLPFEACVKKEKQWCFGSSYLERKSPKEINECGKNLEKAMMSPERLHRIHEYTSGFDYDQKYYKQILSDKIRIEQYVRTYEETRNKSLGLDFSDPLFEKRCEIYNLNSKFTPDVQAIWLESPQQVIIAFRGTEADNMIDWATDFATSFRVTDFFLPFWKRNVHSGYELSLEVMNNWLEDEIHKLFTHFSKASEIPIYITGHSMGGAIATLAMTSLLERNQRLSNRERLNLKAIYTFGSPRIGNLDYAQYFESLVQKEGIGVYRVVNKRDLVSRAPCIDYNHFGTNIQLLSPEHSPSPPVNVNVLVNPKTGDYNYCAFGVELIENIINIKKYARDHYLESYYNILYTLRKQFHEVLKHEETYNLQGALKNENLFNSYRYPLNCNRVVFKNSLIPSYLKYNYQKLPFEIEM